MYKARYVLNLVAAFLFSILLTLGEGKHDKVLWLLALAVLPLGIWLMRSNPPWWHSSSTLASLAAGRLCTNFWRNAHKIKTGPVWDDFVWFLVVIALFLFLTELGKLRGRQSKT
jgi:hypothetical protein